MQRNSKKNSQNEIKFSDPIRVDDVVQYFANQLATSDRITRDEITNYLEKDPIIKDEVFKYLANPLASSDPVTSPLASSDPVTTMKVAKYLINRLAYLEDQIQTYLSKLHTNTDSDFDELLNLLQRYVSPIYREIDQLLDGSFVNGVGQKRRNRNPIIFKNADDFAGFLDDQIEMCEIRFKQITDVIEKYKPSTINVNEPSLISNQKINLRIDDTNESEKKRKDTWSDWSCDPHVDEEMAKAFNNIVNGRENSEKQNESVNKKKDKEFDNIPNGVDNNENQLTTFTLNITSANSNTNESVKKKKDTWSDWSCDPYMDEQMANELGNIGNGLKDNEKQTTSITLNNASANSNINGTAENQTKPAVKNRPIYESFNGARKYPHISTLFASEPEVANVKVDWDKKHLADNVRSFHDKTNSENTIQIKHGISNSENTIQVKRIKTNLKNEGLIKKIKKSLPKWDGLSFMKKRKDDDDSHDPDNHHSKGSTLRNSK